jgi:hypothetical protein
MRTFLSIAEVCEITGKTEDEITQLVRQGQLRQFRDAGRKFYKRTEIDELMPVVPQSTQTDKICTCGNVISPSACFCSQCGVQIKKSKE